MRIFYVYMHNSTSRDDDEVFKVKAKDKEEAKEVANKCQQWPGRFSIGTIHTAQECPKDLKWWATDHTNRRT